MEKTSDTKKSAGQILKDNLVSMEELTEYVNGVVAETVNIGSTVRVTANNLLRRIQKAREELTDEGPKKYKDNFGNNQPLSHNLQLLAVKVALLDEATSSVQKAHDGMVDVYKATRRALFTQLEAENGPNDLSVNFTVGAFGTREPGKGDDDESCNCAACQLRRKLTGGGSLFEMLTGSGSKGGSIMDIIARLGSDGDDKTGDVKAGDDKTGDDDAEADEVVEGLMPDEIYSADDDIKTGDDDKADDDIKTGDDDGTKTGDDDGTKTDLI